MDRVTVNVQSDHRWQPDSQALTQRLHSHLVSGCNLPHIEHNGKLQNNIRENEILVCIINDAISYFVYKMVRVSLNLNEYRIHLNIIYIRLQNRSLRD